MFLECLIQLGSVQALHQHVLGGGGDLSQNADTAVALEADLEKVASMQALLADNFEKIVDI